MNIVILNECFFLDHHLDKLKSLGNVQVYQDTIQEEDVIARIKNADVAIVNGLFAPLNKRVLESAKNLKFLALNTTGYDGIDMETATKRGIKVANAAGYATDSVAEHTIALMFSVLRQIPKLDRKMRESPFQVDPADKENEVYMGLNVKGKTLGIIGLGAIGSRLAELGKGLGMNVIAFNRSPKNMDGVRMVEKEELLKTADVVSINLALTPETEHIIGKKELSLMKSTAVLINTARGKHVDTNALYEALRENKIYGAGIDALEEWDQNNPLLGLKNIVLTPHQAFFTKESLENLSDLIVTNVESFIKGSPINLVN